MRSRKNVLAGAALMGVAVHAQFASAALINAVSLNQTVTETYGSPAGVSPVAHTQTVSDSGQSHLPT